MVKTVTPEERLVRIACVWRQADKNNVVAKREPDAKTRQRTDDKLHREMTRLRDATDAYMRASKPD